MEEDAYATRREVDQLREEVHRIDDHGSRGVGVIQSQLTDLVKDVVELKIDVGNKFDAHFKVHEQDKRDRIYGRRWIIGTIIGAVAAMGGLYVMLLQILSSVH